MDGWDVVLIARSGVKTVDYQQLYSAVMRLLRRAKILADVHEAGRLGRVQS